MNPAQVHLALNHIPIIGLFFVLIFLGYGILTNSSAIQRISLILIVFIALATIPVFLSGEPAEEIVEESSSVSHDIIHEHEEAGELAFIVMEGLGILAIVALILLNKEKLTNVFRYVFLIAGIVTFILMLRVGKLGGKIMHPEIDGEISVHEEHHEH